MNYPKPFGERILVKRKKIERKIIIESERINEGEIVAVGEDRKDAPMRLNVGDKVMFTGYGTTNISIDEDKENQYLLMLQGDVLAVLS